MLANMIHDHSMALVVDVRDYEAVMVLREMNAEKLSTFFDALYDSFEKRGAEIIQKEDWGLKDLFHISGNAQKGHFNFFRFHSAGQQIKNIYSDLKLNPNILKIIITKVSHGK